MSTLGVLAALSALAAASPAPTPPTPRSVSSPGGPPPKAEPPQKWEITVEAGPLDRDDLLLKILLRGRRAERGFTLRNAAGALVPAQSLPDGGVAFVVPSLRAGGRALFRAAETRKPAARTAGPVKVTENPSGITATIGGQPALSYVGGGQAPREGLAPELVRTGYLHPLVTPAGIVVTGDYPTDKPHQHGIWSAWAAVDFEGTALDFWDPLKKTGRVARESMGPATGGPILGHFMSHQYFGSLLGRRATALRETWKVTTRRSGKGRARATVVDIDSTLVSVTGKPVTLGQHPFGGILFRGPNEWQGAAHSTFLTSEGATRAPGKAARWIYLGGTTGGRAAGVAILAHPDEPKGSQAFYVHAEDPLMGFSPTQARKITIQGLLPLKQRYRFIALDGAPDEKLIESLWRDYATPPAVEVRPAPRKSSERAP